VFPHVGAGFWPLIGLAGVLGGEMRSPFTGIVFAVELTGRFDAVLPLIIGTGVAFGASVLLLRRSVLTEKVARRGFHLTREYDVDPLEALFVDEVLADRFVQLDATTTVRQAHELLLTDPVAGAQRLLPVVDSEQALVAIVTENRLTAALTRGRDQDLVITHAQRDPVCAHGNDTLRQAALVMADSGLTRLVVTDRADPHRPVGVVSLQQLLEGRLRDLHEQKHPERLLTVRLPRLDAGRALARRRTAAVKTEE
jgi:CBS domain-containing protein